MINASVAVAAAVVVLVIVIGVVDVMIFDVAVA